MIRAYSVDDVRSAEAAAMADLPDGELMRRASEGLAEVAAARLVARDGRTVAAIVGGGDNGGDALYAAALLSQAGFACAAVLVPDTGRVGVHQGGIEAAEAAGVHVVAAAEDSEGAAQAVAEADLVLDGITGIGGRPGLRDSAAALVEAIGDDAWVLAVDLASGLDPAGVVEPGPGQEHVWADETVTFGVPKPVHLLPAGEAASGRLTVVEIGVDLADRTPAVERLTFDDVSRLWPVPGPSDDKYSRGVLGVVAGGERYTGAAILSVTAAVESGAGMVRYIGTRTPTELIRAGVPEAVLGDGQVQAWLIGPGLDVSATGREAEEQLRVARAALEGELPVVLDAGGLDLVTAPRTAPTLLTPHAGELARMLSRLERDPVSRPEVEREPVTHARRLAAATGAVVLLKGSTTLVVSPDPAVPVRSQADAPAWLATAGSGDVLSGILGTLLAAGLDPRDAGSLGSLVHGVSADIASSGGPLRALAVARGIPGAVRQLLGRAG
jgi:hydroxyethylthiazole kinase-like uncharacterized protein yjeF